MVPAVFKMQNELKEMKDNQMKLLQMVEKMTQSFENEADKRVKTEEELGAVKF